MEAKTATKRLLVRVRTAEGRDYLIYDDGSIDGFGQGARVFNYLDAILSSEIVQHDQRRGTSDHQSACPTHSLMSAIRGASQTAPL